MTGPEHYREAEELVATAISMDSKINGSDPARQNALAAASTRAAQIGQVHATLALAAATAIGEIGAAEAVIDAWAEVAQ